MDVEVLPGPSLAERARTAITQARLATVSWGDPAARWDGPAAGGGRVAGAGGWGPVTATAAIRVDRLGRPLLLLPPREAVTEALAAKRRVAATRPDPAPPRAPVLTRV